MIELTADQRRQLTSDAPCVIAPETQTRYVQVREDVYERIELLLVPERMTETEQRAALHAAALRAGWDDPDMDVYDREATLDLT